MIRHVVAFRLKGETSEARRTQSEGIKERLSPLRDSIPGVLALELGDDLGRVESHWHLVLLTEHPDYAALQAYLSHPLHQAPQPWINTVVDSRAVIDYEVK